MGLCGVNLLGVIECISFGLVITVGLIGLSMPFLVSITDLVPEMAPQAKLISIALIIILSCAVVVISQLRLIITQAILLLDWIREDLDAGRTNWTGQREADAEPRDVEVVRTIDPEHNHSTFHRASETKLCMSRILELSTVPTAAVPYHDFDQSSIRVTYDSTPVMLPKAHIFQKRSSFGLTDPIVDLHASKDTKGTPKSPDFDENPFKDEDNSLAAELQEVESQKAAQVSECGEPREVNHPCYTLACCAFLHPLLYKTLTSSMQKACLLFSRWPLEIRRLVYHELMVVASIDHPDRLVDDRLTTLVTSKAQKALYKLGIDATVLRTCRLIYIEALPMLYGENNFVFFSVLALSLFRDKGLVSMPCKYSLLLPRRTHILKHTTNSDNNCEFIDVPSFSFGQNLQGRLCLIRRLTLVLTDRREDQWGLLHPSRTDDWSEFLHESRFERRIARPCVDFPALDDLTLDFLDWALTSEEEIVVSKAPASP